jgi:short-subunit dehydrogenase
VELGGKTALLTGATGGLGRAIARALADRGVSLVLSSRKPEELSSMAEELPGEHRVAPADLAEEGAALELVQEAGEVDVLVANAGLPASGKLDTYSQRNLGRALRVNLESPIRMTRELLTRMLERDEGHLLYVSSMAGRVATPRASLYAATKFGLRGFALNLREDLRGTGIGVSVVLPGAIREAGMLADSGAQPRLAALLGTGTPAQVGAAVVRAIERDRPEIVVATRRQRTAARVMSLAPELSARVAGRSVERAADEITGGQTEKR